MDERIDDSILSTDEQPAVRQRIALLQPPDDLDRWVLIVCDASEDLKLRSQTLSYGTFRKGTGNSNCAHFLKGFHESHSSERV